MKTKYRNRQTIRPSEIDEAPRFKHPLVKKKQFWNSCLCLKPAIHLYFIPFHLSQHCFSPPIQVQKSGTSFHRKFQSALAVEENDLLSPSIPRFASPTPRISDLLPALQGLDLVKSFEMPTTLEKVPTKDSAHEPQEFGLVGNPTFHSRYAIFHRFSTLTLVFSFPCSKISILEEI
ncbi:hypothetical protein AVEN_144803-1 [Araneus ventricosus]|uniref:Uncharacterized protein n=1 Tax=Araneus ventricosus TaxID=182803 RepID=A0A4Y2NFM8_ARAVE|nr:hypothetical protein AVEN_144803-1 [Araneus ventricosus]